MADNVSMTFTGGGGSSGGTPDGGLREAWQPGDLAWYEYRCLESDDSGDAALWHRSHQQVTVLGRGADEDFGGTLTERAEACCPNVYQVRFPDGCEGTAWEDELLTGPEHYERPDPPVAQASLTGLAPRLARLGYPAASLLAGPARAAARRGAGAGRPARRLQEGARNDRAPSRLA
jgi:hypothetical protein